MRAQLVGASRPEAQEEEVAEGCRGRGRGAPLMCLTAVARERLSARVAEPPQGDNNSGPPGLGLHAAPRPSDSGGDRGRDPFPLPVPRARYRSAQHSSVRRSRAEIGKELRVAESARSLNALASASAATARHEKWQVPLHSKTRPSDSASLAQRSILE